MMKKIINNLLIITGCLFMFSCMDDLDEIKLGSNSQQSEAAWKEAATYDSFLAKVYAGFSLSGNQGPDGNNDLVAGDQGEATWVRSYFSLQQFCTDEVRVAWKNDELDDLQFCNWSSDNHFLSLSYSRMFLNIAYANEYLRETTADKMNSRGINADAQENVKTYREEVRVLRAMNYYFLMDLFANIPLILENDGVGDYQPVQKTRKEIFQWLETELSTIGQLPSKSQYGRVNKYVVAMLLAKMYLNAEVYIGEAKYTECLTQLNKILSEGEYALDPTYRNIFGADNHQSPEMIYAMVYDGLKASSWGGTTFLIAFEAASDMDTGTSLGFNQAWLGGRAPQNFYPLFTSEDKRGMFWTQGRTDEIIDLYDFNQGWSVVKYTNLTRYGQPGSSTQYADTDFPLWRLADVYLMYAEAVVRGGQGGTIDQALTYINALQTRAGITKTISRAQLTLDFLRTERSRELYWEGHRRTDLIRFDSFTDNYSWPWKGGTITGTQRLDDKYKIYPLPSDQFSLYENLQQNPGY